jgi:hypothetical protein
VSVLNPIKAWRCEQHGLVQHRNSAGRCPHQSCDSFLDEPLMVVPVEWVTPIVRRAVEMGRRQEMQR